MDAEICDDFMVGKFAPALLTTAHEHSRGNFHFSISRFAGTFIFQFRDFNFDTGTVAGIFIFQFRELNCTVAGILIFQFRDFNFDTGTVAGIFTSFFQSIARTRAFSFFCIEGGACRGTGKYSAGSSSCQDSVLVKHLTTSRVQTQHPLMSHGLRILRVQ